MTGQPFLATVVANHLVAVEIAKGADLTDLDGSGWTWTDITDDVVLEGEGGEGKGGGGEGGGISITIGRADESSETQTSLMTCTLDNRDGAYSDGGLSANWPYIRRGLPVRVRVSANNGSTWKTRFQGSMNGVTPQWDAETGRWATVELSASGPLRRLDQGTQPPTSALRRYLENNYAAENISAYWAMEELKGVGAYQRTQGATSYGGIDLVNVLGGSVSPFWVHTGRWDLWNMGSTETSFTAPLTEMYSNNYDDGWMGYMRAPFPASNVKQVSGVYVPSSNSGTYTIIWSMFTMSEANYDEQIWAHGALTGTPGNSSLEMSHQSNGSVELRFYLGKQEGASSYREYIFQAIAGNSNARPFRWRVWWTGSQFGVGFVRSGETTEQTATQSYSNNPITFFDRSVICPIRQIYFAGGGSDKVQNVGSVGHLAYHTAATSLVASAQFVGGYFGEAPKDRIVRLGADAGIHVDVLNYSMPGYFGPTDTMGPQRYEPVTDLIRECERTGAGVLIDGWGPGLTYITKNYRENAANATPTMTLDASAGQIMEPFAPIDDDQLTINEATVTRRDGVTVAHSDLTGPRGTNTIGVYSTTLDVNPENDYWLRNYSEWRVHQGTQEGYRYPSVSFALDASTELIAPWLLCTPQSRIDVTNIISVRRQHPDYPIKLLIEGWHEEIGLHTWRVTCNTSRAEVWNVVRLAAATGSTGDAICHMDTDSSQLNASVSAGATSISVRTNSGPLWVTSAADADSFPFDIDIGGLRATVAAISGASSPQTFTLSAPLPRALTGSATPGAGVPIKVWRQSVLGL